MTWPRVVLLAAVSACASFVATTVLLCGHGAWRALRPKGSR